MEREVDSLMLKGAGRTFSREGVGGGGGKRQNISDGWVIGNIFQEICS